jgi:hypothetical protein
MTKKKRILSNEMPLFEWLQKAKELACQTSFQPKGSLNIDNELKAAISEDLRHAEDDSGREISRYQVAARMSDFLGQEVTVSMLNNWTAESHENHRFPAAWLPAFVHGTGGQRRTIETLSRHCGLFALPGPEALRAEIQKIEEEIKAKSKEKSKRMLLLKEIDK